MTAFLMRVIRQGAVRVHSAAIHKSCAEIVCIQVDLRSKRAIALATCDAPAPMVTLCADEHTLHLDPQQHADSTTEIEFPAYAGWDVFAVDGPARYTLSIVLTKRTT